MRTRIDFGRSIGPLCVGLAALTFKTNQKSKKAGVRAGAIAV